MWLLFNDLILGFALGSFIREGYPVIATLVSTNFEVRSAHFEIRPAPQAARAETIPRIYDKCAHLVGCMACGPEAQQ